MTELTKIGIKWHEVTSCKVVIIGKLIVKVVNLTFCYISYPKGYISFRRESEVCWAIYNLD